jgi:hypothetical protein
MKKFLLLASFCLASNTRIEAQTVPQPARKLATIQPEARDLLARLDARYKRFKTFSCLVELRTSEPVPWKYARYRMALDGRFSGAITMAIEGQGTQKSIYDGKTVLKTDSRFPRRYTLAKIDAELYGIRLFLRRTGAEGQVERLLLDDKIASAFLDPDLQSVEMGAPEKLNDKTLQSVIIKMEGEYGKASLSLLIDEENLTLRRVVGNDSNPAQDKKTFVFTEDYSDIRFDEALPNSLFSTKPPVGFREIDSFDSSSQVTTTPVIPN